MPETQLRRSPPPAFTPVRLRVRTDGWSPEAQCVFLAALYVTGSAASAAKAAGKSRAAAYALKKRDGAESFRAAWDHILAGPAEQIAPVAPGAPPIRSRKVADWRKLTLRDLYWRHKIGLWRPVVYRGKMRGIARKPDNSALLRLLRRLDSVAARASYHADEAAP